MAPILFFLPIMFCGKVEQTGPHTYTAIQGFAEMVDGPTRKVIDKNARVFRNPQVASRSLRKALSPKL